ncbi:MAG: MoaD family protein [Pelovirga sp.]
MIKVQFYGMLRLLLRREALEVTARAGDTIASLLPRVQQQLQVPMLHKLINERGEPHAGTIIMVNRRNVHHLQKLETPVQAGDTVALFPPGAGG